MNLVDPGNSRLVLVDLEDDLWIQEDLGKFRWIQVNISGSKGSWWSPNVFRQQCDIYANAE